MTSGEVAPPWGAPQFAPPRVDLTDDELRRLPPPGWTPSPDPRFSAPDGSTPPPGPVRQSTPAYPPFANVPAAPGRPSGHQRPAVVGLATTLAVTASLQWVCGLALAWLASAGALDALGQRGSNGVVFHLLDEFGARLRDGLALPLFAFPLASTVTGFLLLSGRRWARVLHTVLGVVALGWSAWWLRDTLLWWAPVALYVGVACAVLWTPAANRWFDSREQRGRSDPVAGSRIPH